MHRVPDEAGPRCRGLAPYHAVAGRDPLLGPAAGPPHTRSPARQCEPLSCPRGHPPARHYEPRYLVPAAGPTRRHAPARAFATGSPIPHGRRALSRPGRLSTPGASRHETSHALSRRNPAYATSLARIEPPLLSCHGKADSDGAGPGPVCNLGDRPDSSHAQSPRPETTISAQPARAPLCGRGHMVH